MVKFGGPERAFNPVGRLSEEESSDFEKGFHMLLEKLKKFPQEERDNVASLIRNTLKAEDGSEAKIKSNPEANMIIASLFLDAYLAERKSRSKADREHAANLKNAVETADPVSMSGMDPKDFAKKYKEFVALAEKYAEQEEKHDNVTMTEASKSKREQGDNWFHKKFKAVLGQSTDSHGNRGRKNGDINRTKITEEVADHTAPNPHDYLDDELKFDSKE